MDEDPLLWQLLILLLLILLNAFFASAEVALLSIKPASLRKLEQEGGRRGRRLARLAADSGRFLSAIQVGVTFAGFLASAFAADSFAMPLTKFLMRHNINFLSESTLQTVSVVVVTLLLSFVSLVFGELVPKQIGLRYAETVSLRSAGAISLFAKLTAPFVWILNLSVSGVLKLFKVAAHDRNDITEEEIRLMVDIGEENGTIDSDERQMIENIFKFNDILAEEVMTHRTEVVAISIDASPQEVEKCLNESAFSRIPVYRESVDQIIGFLHFRDYFSAKMNHGATPELGKILKPVYLAPASMRANVLFRNMQRQKYGMAVILDEYGGTAGLVTIEDLLEEIVGSLYDEFDEPAERYRKLGENTWRIDGSMRMDEVTKVTGIEFPHSEFDTLGGLVFEKLDEVPSGADELELPEYRVKLIVEAVNDRRIDKLLLKHTPKVNEE